MSTSKYSLSPTSIGGFLLHVSCSFCNNSRVRFLEQDIYSNTNYTGINAIIYYAPTIFKSIGMTGNSSELLATGVIGIVDCVFTIPAVFFLDRFVDTCFTHVNNIILINA